MPPACDVFISELLCQRLLKHSLSSTPTLGYVFGHISKRGIQCVGCAVQNDGVVQSFGYSVVGVFCLSSSLSDNEVYELCQPFLLKYQQEGAMGSNLEVAVILHTDTSKTAVSTQLVSLEADCPMEPKSVTMVPDIHVGTCTVRARASLMMPFEIDPDPKFLQQNLEVAASRIKRRLAAEVLSFQLDGTEVLMRRNSSEKALSDLVDQSGDGSKQRRLKNTQRILSFAVLVQCTGEPAMDACGKSCTPVIHYQRRTFKSCSVVLPLDVVATVGVEDPVADVVDLLAQELVNQVDQLVCCISRFSKGDSVCSAQPFHFWPAKCGHWVTVVYPDGVSQENLLPYRRELHRLLLLPEDQPHFRKSNVYAFPDDLASEPYLRNVHVGLNPPSGCEVQLVFGQYRYRHYQQDRMDDNGWGCAYRSLQTIISWFQLQGYTECATPTHREIQQILVDIGDKPSSFVGSKQWIGSQEVGFVLNRLLGVEYRTMFVSSGAELPTKSRELMAHFEKHGTPVMIGGGMLAHTIIGIAFDSKTGESHYLVLDPHYTGGEDLSTVQNKGWCGWKGANFWDQNSFYNLCLPQRHVDV
ncbi:UFM1 specific peptidase 2 [Rhipicephalus microplus]|uniref:UFM1 specific peptidase 2 n=1 Tax=Rhipicephalus microplus TaxID=6941 RepID=UPI003F6B78D2